MTDLRTLEKESIRRFVESCSEHFVRRDVLDLGCGRQPYRDVVEGAGGGYWAWDNPSLPGAVLDVREAIPDYVDLYKPLKRGELDTWPTILCTQVIQYVPVPALWVQQSIFNRLQPGGVLVMTYPTNWPEVEEADLRRFTKAGMTALLVDVGFVIERHERREQIQWQGETFALGYGVVARA